MIVQVLLCLFCIFSVQSQSLYRNSGTTRFNGNFIRYPSTTQGGGLSLGTIQYSAPDGLLQLTNSLRNGKTVTEVYQFSTPFPTGSSVTSACTPGAVIPTEDVYYNSPSNWPAVPTTATCAPTSGNPCTVGTRIKATAVGTTDIIYELDRYDTATCGCAVSRVCVPVPECVDPCSVTATVPSTGTSLTVTCNHNALCPGIGVSVLVNLAGNTAFKVSMSGTGLNLGYGGVAFSGTSAGASSGTNNPVTCPTAVHTCNRAGTGLTKYRTVNCPDLGGDTCEISDISDMIYWPLFYNSDYYAPGVLDSTVTFGGQACYKFAAKNNFPITPSFGPMNAVTTLWLTGGAGGSVCRWDTNRGDQYAMTSYNSGATINPVSTCPNKCNKPLDIVFIIELTNRWTVADVGLIQTWILSLQDNLRINPLETNIGLVSYTPTGVKTDVLTAVNIEQFVSGIKGGAKCCNTDPAAPCCGATSDQLPAAITAAGNLLTTNFPLRSYTSKNIVLITPGGFTNTASQINASLTNAAAALRTRAVSQTPPNPPASGILNFDSYYIGTSKTVVDTLREVKRLNDLRDQNFYTRQQLSTSGLNSQFDTLANRVWTRSSTRAVGDDMREIIGGLCASNGGRACGACCGECTCGTICLPPDRCKKLYCYNETLTPPAPSTSTCCNYPTVYQCPGYNPNDVCNSLLCNLKTDQCELASAQCGAPNDCFTFNCSNANGGKCTAVPRYSDPNKCFQASCDTNNKVVITPKVTCDPRPCHTVQCVNATGECNYTAIPSTPPDACRTQAVCQNGKWVYPWPAACASTNNCNFPRCDSTGTCINVQRCVSDSCTNRTCDPRTTSGCIEVGCPANPLQPNGRPNKCKFSPRCTVVPGAALYSGCVYQDQVCNPTDAACQNSTCLPDVGGCTQTDFCPPIEGTNKCRPLVKGGCSRNANGNYTCTYTDAPCTNNNDPCKRATCDPRDGSCPITTICFPNLNNNKCKRLITSSCPNCTYSDLTCSSTDPCKNTTCDFVNGCPTTLPDICPLYDGGNRCLVRNDSTCQAFKNGVITKCGYTNLNNTLCRTNDPCVVTYCQAATGTCFVQQRCNGVINGKDACQVRDNSTCTTTCRYYPALNCTPANAWTTSVCATNSAGRAYCKNTTLCSAFASSNTNKCSPIIGYNASAGGCIWNTTSPCSGNPGPCRQWYCNPSNGACSAVLVCQNDTSNRCRFTTTCGNPQTGAGGCVFSTVTCPNYDASTCITSTCDPGTGTCSNKTLCDQNPKQANGSPDLCRSLRTPCASTGNPCAYDDFICNPAFNLCQVFRCNPNTGNCNTPIEKCDLFLNGNRCRPRIDNTCPPGNATGGCQYSTITCDNNVSKPCNMKVCDSGTGRCIEVANNSFSAASCPAPTDTCKQAVVDRNQPTCCSVANKCQNGTDRCQITTCVAGSCPTTPKICPDIDPLAGSLCRILSKTPCNSATGDCNYEWKNCDALRPANVDPCFKGTCDAQTGACSYAETPACVDLCKGISCSPLECSNTQCNKTDGKCYKVSDPPLCPPQDGNSCTVGTCNPLNNKCGYSAITVPDCEKTFGPADPCFYWGLSPQFSKCCQQLPFCNAQIDTNFKCMLLTCNSDTGGVCKLVDNSKLVCGDTLRGDPCRPFKSCSNATGACDYYDYYRDCEDQQKLIDPCFDGKCIGGVCVAVNTTRCQSPCVNVNCNSTACERYLCNETNGQCYLDSTTDCSYLVNNCTGATCDPVRGCLPIPFNLSTCGITDPCITVFENRSKIGCCDTRPTCPDRPDPICNPTQCRAGNCSYGTPAEVCPPFRIDNTTGRPNRCLANTDCAGGCVYQPKDCPPPLAACFRSDCDPDSGNCTQVDTCRKDKCEFSVCNPQTGVCDVQSSAKCLNDTCTVQICIPAIGCVTDFARSKNITRDCNASKCQVAIANPQKVGCCDYVPKCVPDNGCSNATCVPSTGQCVFTSVCPPKKCSDASCIIRDDGTPECLYNPKPCQPTSVCEVVSICNETDPAPYECVRSSACPKSDDPCVAIICEIVAGEPVCKNVSTITCDDNDNCTTDKCVAIDGKATCSFITCPTVDPCTPRICDATQGTCVDKPIVCNDFNACTTDVCVNGNCTYTNINCDDGDNCTIDSCDSTLGCVRSVRTCSVSEPCYYYGDGESPETKSRAAALRRICVPDAVDDNDNGNNGNNNGKGNGKGNGNSANGTAPERAAGIGPCDQYYCTNSSCVYLVRTCSNIFSTAAIVGTALAAGTLAGIIVAAVLVCLGASGGTVAAVYNKNKGDKAAPILNNPLFKGNQREFHNPLNNKS